MTTNRIGPSIADSLAQPAIDNGPSLAARARARRVARAEKNGPVVVARQPVEPAVCDADGERVDNWAEMRAHYLATSHVAFTKIEEITE